MTFTQWLRRQVVRADPIGDLARDAASDPDWPAKGSLEDYEALCRDDAVRDILNAAWGEYQESGGS